MKLFKNLGSKFNKRTVVNNKWLILIIVVATLLRLLGIQHGFPFITHPDEPSTIRSALGIRFEPNPKHFDWPHLYFYLNYFVYMGFLGVRKVFQVLSLRPTLEAAFPLLWRDPLVFYFISRVLSALFGVFTVIPVYLTGKELFNKCVGLFGATALALFPFHVWHSHYALIDVPMAFFLAFSMYFSARIFTDGRLRYYLLAGLFAGFAASTKYNGALVSLLVPLAHFLAYYKNTKQLSSVSFYKPLVFAGIFAFIGFTVGTPYSVLDYDTFLRDDGPKGALWQFKNVGKVSPGEQIVQFVQNIFGKLMENFGYTLMVVYLASASGFIFGWLTKSPMPDKRKMALILLPSLYFLFYVSGFAKTRSHYYFIAYPLVAVVVGYAIYNLVDALKAYNKKVTTLLLMLIFAIPLYFSVLRTQTFLSNDTRNDLYDWMRANVEDGDYIVYDSNSLEPVLEKFSATTQKKGVRLATIEGRKGYVLLGLNESEEREFKSGKGQFSVILDKVTEEVTFEPGQKTGPYIVVLSFDDVK